MMTDKSPPGIPGGAPECLKTQFCITTHTIYCVCVICKILYVVFPRSAGEHNGQFSDDLACPELS